MSRLQQHNKKQFSQKLFITFILIIAFIVFFFSLGIKMLVSFTLFINQLANGKTNNSQTQQVQTLRSISIDPIAAATSSSVITFSGNALGYDKLEIFLNDEKRDEMAISDTFAGDIQGLEKGDNTIYFIAKSTKEKKTEQSQDYSVTYKSEKPKLEVSEPGDNSRTNKEDVRISGTTDKEVEIRINGQPIIVDAGGKFTTLLRLKDGENKIEILAEDIVGNQEKKSLTVTYAKDD